MSEGMKQFLSFFIPAFSGWYSTTAFLLACETHPDWSLEQGLLLFLATPIYMGYSLICWQVWISLLLCAGFGLAMRWRMARKFKYLVSLSLALGIYTVVSAGEVAHAYAAGSETSFGPLPPLLLPIVTAFVTGGTAWLTTSRLFPFKSPMPSDNVAVEPRVADSPLQNELEGHEFIKS